MSSEEAAIDHVATQKKILLKLKIIITIALAAKSLSEAPTKTNGAMPQGKLVHQVFSKYWSKATADDPEPAESWRYMRNNRQLRGILEQLGVSIDGKTPPTPDAMDETRLSLRNNFTDEDLQQWNRFIRPSPSSMSGDDNNLSFTELFTNSPFIFPS
jgi:hypothetical protein